MIYKFFTAGSFIWSIITIIHTIATVNSLYTYSIATHELITGTTCKVKCNSYIVKTSNLNDFSLNKISNIFLSIFQLGFIAHVHLKDNDFHHSHHYSRQSYHIDQKVQHILHCHIWKIPYIILKGLRKLIALSFTLKNVHILKNAFNKAI